MASNDPWIGKVLGNCRLEKLLGEGSMGCVYRAHHEVWNIPVAVKILHPACLAGKSGKRNLKRFEREAKYAGILEHPHIVKIFESGEKDGIFYLVMEFLSGRSLLDIILEQGSLPVERVLQIAQAASLALKTFHDKHIVHRDIKPSNIIITDDGTLKLTDFGLACLINGNSSISQTGQIIGTIYYMSPEQARGNPQIDHRADFYSLGATLFQALTGKLPYVGRTPIEVLQQHISAPVPSLKPYLPNIHPQVEALIQKLMQKKTQSRFQNDDEVLAHIALCQKALAKPDSSSSLPLRTARWQYLLLPQWSLSIIFILLLGFILTTIAFSNRKDAAGTSNLAARIPEIASANLSPISSTSRVPISDSIAKVLLPTESVHTPVTPEDIPFAASDTRGWFGEKIPEGLRRAARPGEYIWEKDGGVMVYVPEGEFWMGDGRGKFDERPLRKVYLDAYYIDKYELRWEQYAEFCKITGHTPPPPPEEGVLSSHPVVNVSWEDTKMYAAWVKKRLPTEAEWEKAARGGFKIPDWEKESAPLPFVPNPYPRRSYPWGEELPHTHQHFYCNYVAHDHWQRRGEDGYLYTAPVGSFVQGASPYQCVDMAGNVWEWCEDNYHEKAYEVGVTKNPLYQSSGTTAHVLRGGSWFNFAESCRTTRRSSAPRNARLPWVGIRLAW